jgi:hypothetical protein
MTLTDLLVPTWRNMLLMLKGLLDKAEAQLGADNAEALLSARLAPDMWPLAIQLRLAALQAVGAGSAWPCADLTKPDHPEGDRVARRAYRRRVSKDRDWALGQFYFHVMTAYAILRNEGVAIGKADYVPHMFGYLRAEAVP